MTLIVGLISKETIWLMGDRRLTQQGKVVSDHAVKVMEIETMQNDIALIGYSGLGATAKGREVSDWINSALRGRNLPLEDLLKILAKAVLEQIPEYLSKVKIVDKFQHNIVIPLFHDNKAKIYSIDIIFDPKTRKYDFRFTQHVSSQKKGEFLTTPRCVLAGSGSQYLKSNKEWIRLLLSLANKSDKGRLRPEVVANQLAKINFKVSKNLSNNTVGPNSIVVWRNRRVGRHNGGGSHKFYTGDEADKNTPAIHTLAGGMDIKAISDILMPVYFQNFGDNTEADRDLINNKISQIPTSPSEKLDL